MTQGGLYIHSAPRALAPHIEWAASGVLGVPAKLVWREQPVAPGLVRSELSWRGREDTGARLASAIRGWDDVRYEVVQDATAQADGSDAPQSADSDALPAWVWVAGIAGLAVLVVAFLLMGRRARALGHLDDGR